MDASADNQLNPRPCVLLVDDDAAIRKLCVRALESANLRVRTACSAEIALEILIDDHAICLVVSDIQMPKMDGHELSARIASSRPGLPVLLMSGDQSELPARDSSLEALPRFISKPFTAETLVAVVLAWIASLPPIANAAAR